MFGKLTGRDFLAFGIGLNTSIVAMDLIIQDMIPQWDLSLTPFNVGVILFGGYILCTTGEKHVRNDSDQLPGECVERRCSVRQGGSEDQ